MVQLYIKKNPNLQQKVLKQRSLRVQNGNILQNLKNSQSLTTRI